MERNAVANTFESSQDHVHALAELVEKIRLNDPEGMEELYRVFTRGVRLYLFRQLGQQDLEDQIHDTFLIVSQAIRRGELREPDRLMGYIRTIVRRHVASQIADKILKRKREFEMEWGFATRDTKQNPEQHTLEQEAHEIAMHVLRKMAPHDREILIRFYLHEQSAEEICSEMNLTATQFRLQKSRAKALFGRRGKRTTFRTALSSWLDVPRIPVRVPSLNDAYSTSKSD